MYLYQSCSHTDFINVKTTYMNACGFNFHFQANINIEKTFIKVNDQRCFNIDSKLMRLLKKNKTDLNSRLYK